MARPDLLEELSWRGLIHAQSEGVPARLARGPIGAYIGFDASAVSLHVGNLMQVFLLAHLQRSGGRPVVLVGSGTGMIGDPSGKSSERRLLDDETIARNSAALRGQLGRFLEFGDGPSDAVMLDNREWLGAWRLLDFLRDVGKHFTVPYMLSKESVQQRLQAGLSFTEFSYMTLQAADFLHLYREHGVEMQMGGADQWGNITAGLELIRRVEGREEGAEPAYGLCSPLLLTRSGQKMGKSERGAVFLDPSLTPPFEFYQYWLNDDDALVGQHLRWLTFLGRDEIVRLEAEHAARPEARPAQRALARELTAMVHGPDETERQERLASIWFDFSRSLVELPDDELRALLPSVPHLEAPSGWDGGSVMDLAVGTGFVPSRGEFRRLVASGGAWLNGERVTDVFQPAPDPIHGQYWELRRGKERALITLDSRGEL
jgi:tyrosyl-tRNA synthetase